MSKKKSKRQRLKRDVHLAEKNGASPGRLHELDIRINVLCNRGRITPVEAYEWKDRLALVKKKPEPFKPKGVDRPGDDKRERRQFDRGDEPSRAMTVANVLALSKMRGTTQ